MQYQTTYISQNFLGMHIKLAGVNTLNFLIKARRIFLFRPGIFRYFKRIDQLQFSIVMHLEKLLLERPREFHLKLFQCCSVTLRIPFKLIEVGTDINITTSFIAALFSCLLVQVQIILLNFLSVHENWK